MKEEKQTLIQKFLQGHQFLITLSILAFFQWVTIDALKPFVIILLCLLAFLPLCSKDGKNYFALFLFNIICSPVQLSFDNISIALIAFLSSTIISLILHLIIYKNKLSLGYMFLPIVIFIALHAVSYIIYACNNIYQSSYPIFYVLILFGYLISYILLKTSSSNSDSFLYFAKSVALLSLVISLQIIWVSVIRGFEIASADFTLGWSTSSKNISALLILSLPFSAMLINKKKAYYAICSIASIAGIIFLSTDTALLALILAFIPLLILAFKGYKNFSYIVLISSIVLIIVFFLLFALNQTFNERILTAVQSLNFIDQPDKSREQAINKGIEIFKEHFIFGNSLYVCFNDKNVPNFFSNTLVTSMATCGIFGILSILYIDFQSIFKCLKSSSENKYYFLSFILLFIFLGLFSDTLYSLSIFPVFLLAHCAFEKEDTINNIQVHSDFYDVYNVEDLLNSR